MSREKRHIYKLRVGEAQERLEALPWCAHNPEKSFATGNTCSK